jgi:hypothetical protein
VISAARVARNDTRGKTRGAGEGESNGLARGRDVVSACRIIAAAGILRSINCLMVATITVQLLKVSSV